MKGLICCTMDCNLACDYCFERNGDRKCWPNRHAINAIAQASRSKILRFIRELYVVNNGHNTDIIWHGGEPMLINPDFLRGIMQQIKDEGVAIQWGMQSNGTLLNAAYRELVSDFHIGLGISIDGLREHHDRYRVMKNGAPTFDLIMHNLEQMSTGQVGLLLTITDQNVNSLKEIYTFCAERNLSFGFNALFPSNNPNETATLSALSFAEKICELFDIWIEDTRHTIRIHPFMHIIEALFFPEHGIPRCNCSKNCSKSFVTMDMDGNLYNCEHWVGNPDFCFGNIDDGLATVLPCNTFFDGRVEALKNTKCGQCEIFSLCYGGCPWSALQLTGSVMGYDSSICEGQRRLVHHIYDYVQTHYKKQPIKFRFNA